MMAYRFRAYLPAAGVSGANVYMGNTYQTTIASDGGTSAKYDASGITTSMTVRDVSIAAGYAFSRWVINIDGMTTYSYSTRLDISYSSAYSNVQVRMEVEEVTTYYVTVKYSANGGSGAPAQQSGSSTNQFVRVTLSSTEPERSGYDFLGWALNSSTATTPDARPGETVDLYGTEAGVTYTYYAVWQQASSGSARIYDGYTWYGYTPYIFDGYNWIAYNPKIYNGGW